MIQWICLKRCRIVTRLFVENRTLVNNDMKNIMVHKTLEVVEVIDRKNEVAILCRFWFLKYKGMHEILEHYLVLPK